MKRQDREKRQPITSSIIQAEIVHIQFESLCNTNKPQQPINLKQPPMTINPFTTLLLYSLPLFPLSGQPPPTTRDQMTKDFQFKDTINFEATIDPDFFLLGTFSDYRGRFEYINRSTQVDHYYPYEESLANYIADFIQINYDIDVVTRFNESRNSEIFSRIIAGKLHVYYDKEGKFKEGIFDTEEQMYSFLTGAFLRYGRNLFDNVFCISVSNSPKWMVIYELLKDLECNKIIYRNLRGNVPNVTLFYFEATPRMLKYFNIVKNENEIIRSEYKNAVMKMLEQSGKEILEDIISKSEEAEKELENSIKIVFKR